MSINFYENRLSFSEHIFSKNRIDKTRENYNVFYKNRVRKTELDIRKDWSEAISEKTQGNTALMMEVLATRGNMIVVEAKEKASEHRKTLVSPLSLETQ